MWRRGRGYDHLFSRDSQKAERETEGRGGGGTSGTAAIREKWTVRMLAKLLSSRAAQKRERGNRSEMGWEQEVYETKYGYIGFISIPFGTYTFK